MIVVCSVIITALVMLCIWLALIVYSAYKDITDLQERLRLAQFEIALLEKGAKK